MVGPSNQTDPVSPPRIVFLLGAGASKEAGVPLTFEFVDEYRKSLKRVDSPLLKPFDLIVGLLNQALSKEASAPAKCDIEAVLSALDTLTKSPLHINALFERRPDTAEVKPEEVTALRQGVEQFIRERGIAGYERLVYLIPFLRFLKDFGPIRVFTTNYDIVLDRFFTATEVPWTDGFRLRWAADELNERPGISAYVYKLQGSVTWFYTESDGFISLPLVEGAERIRLLSGERPTSVILYPARKDTFAGPIVELTRMLQEELVRATYCIVVGYSFRDERFRRVLFDAGVANRSLRLILIGPSADGLYRDVFATSVGDDPTEPGAGIGKFAGRTLRLPLAFETCFSDLVSSILPIFISATDQDRQNGNDQAAGKSPDWAKVALPYAKIGFIDSSDDVDTDLSTDPRDELWQVQYFGHLAISSLLHDNLERARVNWDRVTVLLKSFLTDGQALSVVSQGGPVRVYLNLGYSGPNLPAGGRYGMGAQAILPIIREWYYFAELYSRGKKIGVAKALLGSVAASLKESMGFFEIFTDQYEPQPSLMRFLEQAKPYAPDEIESIQNKLKASPEPKFQPKPDDSATAIFDIGRTIYLRLVEEFDDSFGPSIDPLPG